MCIAMNFISTILFKDKCVFKFFYGTVILTFSLFEYFLHGNNNT